MKLSEIVSLYVFHKRALGHRLRSEEAILRSFCKAVGDGVGGTASRQGAVPVRIRDYGPRHSPPEAAR